MNGTGHWWYDAGSWFGTAGAIPAFIFPVLYHLRARWWETRYGRHLMAFAVVMAALYSVILIAILVPGARTAEWFYGYRLLVYVGIAWLLWRQLWLFLRAQGTGLRTAVRKSAPADPPDG